MEFRIAVPSKKEEREIDDALMAYNLRQAAPTQKDPFVKICRCAKAPDGSLAGGVLACSILWNILYVETVWVREDCRGQRLATRLLDEVEKEAKAHGCYVAQLDTYDFQAKELYEERGYRVFGALEDVPKGHCHYYLVKKLG